MFYATKIKTLGSGGAIDINGRWLRFIGRLPVREGDTVYTDGNVIFGHVPPKAAPMLVSDLSGIPVLGVSYLLADEEQELRGYFTTSGRYKPYKIAKDAWVANSEKKFTHGEEYFKRDEVIDADITDDGKKIIVTSGVYQESHTLNTTNVAFWAKDTRMWGRGIPVYGPYVYEQILGSSAIFSENAPAKLFINDDEQTIDLSLYAKDAEARALSCAEKIMAQSYTGESSYPYVTPEELTQKEIETTGHINGTYFSDGSIDEAAKTRPAEPFITYSTAYILSSNTDEKGFSGIIFAAAHGFCFPYIESRFFANRIRNYGITDDESPDYYLIVGTKAIREWKCVPFGFSCIYKVALQRQLVFAIVAA